MIPKAVPRSMIIAVSVMVLAALGLGLYALKMRSIARTHETATNGPGNLAPPVVGPTEQVTLYVADDASGALHAVPASIPLPSGRQQRAEELFHSLIGLYLDKNSPHALAAGSEVRNVYLVDPGLAVIDLNPTFADSHRSGVLVEELTIASLVQSLTANVPGITQVKVLVDGKERDTLAGHMDLTGYYDVSAINQMVTQLSLIQ